MVFKQFSPEQGMEVRVFWSRIRYHIYGETDQWYGEFSLAQELNPSELQIR